MLARNGGNIGIGTSTANQGKLEVKGGTVCVDTDSDDNATSCITTESDARLKTNVRDLSVSLDTFMKLRPVSFDWKHNDAEVLKHYPLISRFADHPHSIGMIAQEVRALVPEAILPETLGDAEVKYLQLDYTKLVPVLIKALQDVKREKDAEVEALKIQNDALTKRLEAIERIILTPEARERSALSSFADIPAHRCDLCSCLAIRANILSEHGVFGHKGIIYWLYH